jgi:universal stress protein A
MILLTSVLVATDFSAASEAALNYGRNLVRTFGANLSVIHIAEDVSATAAAEFMAPVLGEMQKNVENAARRRIEALLTEDDRTKSHATAIVRVSASAADGIVAYAKQAHVDLIVVGTHGRGAVPHFFMGSVAERVARLAPCPVLTVRPNEHEFILPEPVTLATRM